MLKDDVEYIFVYNLEPNKSARQCVSLQIARIEDRVETRETFAEFCFAFGNPGTQPLTRFDELEDTPVADEVVTFLDILEHYIECATLFTLEELYDGLRACDDKRLDVAAIATLPNHPYLFGIAARRYNIPTEIRPDGCRRTYDLADFVHAIAHKVFKAFMLRKN